MNRLLVFLIWLLPLLIFTILGENGFGISPFFVGLILLLLFFAAGAVMGGGSSEEEEKKEGSISDERIRSLANDLQPFLAVKGWKAVDEIVQFEGSLRTDPAGALKRINDAVDSKKVRVILTEGEQNQVRVTLVPTSAEESAAKQPKWCDLTPLNRSRQVLGYFAFALLALILVPVPHSLIRNIRNSLPICLTLSNGGCS